MKSLKQQSLLFYLFLFSILSSSCVPAFSELQSARTAGKSNFELTGGGSSVHFLSSDDEPFNVQTSAGVQAAYGVNDKLDARLRYEYLWSDSLLNGVHLIAAGPKYSFIKDRFAAYLPIGIAFGEDIPEISEVAQIHPTLLGTLPLTSYLDLNLSGKALIPISDPESTDLAVNLGLGLLLMDKFVLRPEYGLLYSHSDEFTFGQFAVGVTYFPGRNQKNNATPLQEETTF